MIPVYSTMKKMLSVTVLLSAALLIPSVGGLAADDHKFGPDAARDEWTRLKQENADLLGKLSGVAVRTDLGDKGVYYRIQAGSFGDAAAAERLCGELKRRNLGCILAR